MKQVRNWGLWVGAVAALAVCLGLGGVASAAPLPFQVSNLVLNANFSGGGDGLSFSALREFEGDTLDPKISNPANDPFLTNDFGLRAILDAQGLFEFSNPPNGTGVGPVAGWDGFPHDLGEMRFSFVIENSGGSQPTAWADVLFGLDMTALFYEPVGLNDSFDADPVSVGFLADAEFVPWEFSLADFNITDPFSPLQKFELMFSIDLIKFTATDAPDSCGTFLRQCRFMTDGGFVTLDETETATGLWFTVQLPSGLEPIGNVPVPEPASLGLLGLALAGLGVARRSRRLSVV